MENSKEIVISKLKLGQLNKDSMVAKKLSRLMGASYCAWGEENRMANEESGKCSCYCLNSTSYYDTADGINFGAPYNKYD